MQLPTGIRSFQKRSAMPQITEVGSVSVHSNLLIGIRPELRKLGIKRTDLFVCIPDDSPNVGLISLIRKVTRFPTRSVSDSACIKNYFLENVKYVLLLDQKIKSEKCFQIVSRDLESIYKKSQVEIFKLKKNKTMLFNSLHFLFFLPIVVVLYYLVLPRFRWILIFVASCYFYMAFVPKYILVLFLIILIDFCSALAIERTL